MDTLFQPFDPESGNKKRKFRTVPIRTLIPNMITLLAICMGLTAVRMAIEGRFEWAVAAIAAAAILDMLDGRVARMLKATSRFGAELDSLADFVNFGVAPAVILYSWALVDLKSVGWIGVLAFAICCVLRLARFNVALDDDKPAWQSNYFVGMPAPAGAISLLLPLYMHKLGVVDIRQLAIPILVYCVVIAFMMVSRVPTFSGKAIGGRVASEYVAPLFFGFVVFAACLISFPWLTLTVGTIAYLASVPFSIARFFQKKASEAARTQKARAAGSGGKKEPKSKPQKPVTDGEADDDRPAQLH